MESSKKRQSIKEDLTCAICYDLFTEPVMLGCMHHFCKACITTYWRGIRGPVTCPQCRQEFSSRHFQTNYLVAGMVEKVRGSSSDSQELQTKLKTSLESNLSRKNLYMGMMRKDKETVDFIKRASAEIQGQLQVDFQALHHLLMEEEASMLDCLRREQEEMLEELFRHLDTLERAIVEVDENIHSLQQIIDTVEQSFLLEVPEENFRPSVQVDNIPGRDLKTFTAKYNAPLQYIVWRKMFKLLNPAPAPLTFDEKTAHPSLCVSRDKTLVVERERAVACTRTAKRFTQCVNVLSEQGFHTGRHYWEVAVGDKVKWDLGVATEAVDRSTRVKLCPANGYWTLRLRNKDQYWAGTQPWLPLSLASRPRCIGVFLDFETQRVSFYNADTMLLICTFNNGPTGKAFPFFSTCLSEQGQKPQPIRLVHFPLAPL